MKKILALLLAALCLLLALTGCGEKEQSVHVTLYNQSGHDITSVCITPASSDDWGENFLDETSPAANPARTTPSAPSLPSTRRTTRALTLSAWSATAPSRIFLSWKTATRSWPSASPT